MEQFIIFFICVFACFGLLRYVHGILANDIFYKYIFLDAGIYAFLFSFEGFILSLFPKGENPLEEAFYPIIIFIIVPIIYNTIKGYFLIKNHLKLKTIYYPLVEFLIFLGGSISGLQLSFMMCEHFKLFHL